MPTYVAGARGTGEVVSARRVLDIEDKIFNLEPRKSPMVTLLTTIGKSATDGSTYKGVGILKSSCHNPKFSWLSPSASGHVKFCYMLETPKDIIPKQ